MHVSLHVSNWAQSVASYSNIGSYDRHNNYYYDTKLTSVPPLPFPITIPIIMHINVADCGNLTNPENGMVRVSGTAEGDTAEYSCTEGYELNETGTRICGSNGTWSGEEPVCISKLSPLQ